MRCVAANSTARSAGRAALTCSPSRSSPKPAPANGRGRTVRSAASALAVSCTAARALRCRRAHARRRLHDARGARAGYVHRDAVHGRIKPPQSALTALTSGGTIPDTADYAVILEPQPRSAAHEDFAIESMAGDIFQPRQCPYRIQRRRARQAQRRGCARAAAEHPVLGGRGAGRSDALSAAVSRLRETTRPC